MTNESFKETLKRAIAGLDETLDQIGEDLFGHGETLEYYRTKGAKKWKYYSAAMLSRIKAKRELVDLLRKLESGDLTIGEVNELSDKSF